ncbi:RmlC-like cupin domain-containing protein [Trametes elegans]|nr:RmlC-like cupin domain-containing protein [Trametes elegans]
MSMMPSHRAKKRLTLTPLSELRVERYQIPAAGLIPNTSLHNKPLVIYRGVFPAPVPSALEIEGHIAAVGVFEPMWRYPMFPDDHFHTTVHELMVTHSGRARVNFGGEGCPAPVETVMEAGDAVLIPAGVSHRLLEDLGGGTFEMLGAYEVGAEHWDMCYGKPGEEEFVANIPTLKWFDKDPLYGGEDGPLPKS